MNVLPDEDPTEKIWDHILDTQRQIRLDQLLQGYSHDLSDEEMLRKHLPGPYKDCAEDPDQLKASMLTMTQVKRMYVVISTNRISPILDDSAKCFGCIYDSPRQLDHMDDQTGCLSGR